MKKAVYHQAAGSKELNVLAEHEDGTVDLANENDLAVVTNCQVTDGNEVGKCTIISPAKKKSARKTKTKKTNK